MLKAIYGGVSKGIVLGTVLVLFWWILTGLYHNSLIKAYSSTHLQIALLQVDTIFFGGAFLITSILFNIPVENRIINVYRVRNLSIGISILIIANLTTYFTSGTLYVIAIYYQVWSIPGYMLEFYHLFPEYHSIV